MNQYKRIILSRIDNLGDVILTLPLAGILKKSFPDSEIIFIGKKYTKAIIDCSVYIDEFVDYEELIRKDNKSQIEYIKELNADTIVHVFPNKTLARLAQKAKIKNRIGTSHRFFHLIYCNKLLNVGRKNSLLHEAQLNIKLLKPLIKKINYSLDEISSFYGFEKVEKLNDQYKSLIAKNKFNLILHPKSKGSAREWGLDNFTKLVQLLPKDRVKLFVTGTSEEGELIKDFLSENKDDVNDLTGKLSLEQLISFINETDGLVAASTGPLHIAAALKKRAIGIYPPIKPMHPGRWAPIGEKTSFLVLDKACSDCRKNLNCNCMREISPDDVIRQILG